ncbi:MAG: CHASE2 domain-containing protein [Cyanobacteria bacterium P01_G01_bin.38]
MEKRVVLSLGQGSLQTGFSTVTAQLWEPSEPHPMKFTGALPAAPEIPKLYRAWQMLYRAMHHRLSWRPRIEIESADVTNVSEVEFEDLCQALARQINTWLNAPEFRPIDQPLRTHLDTHDEICLVVETNHELLQRLPWHLWQFFDAYPYAEAALSPPSYQRASKAVQTSGAKVKILVILGNSDGIDVERDRTYLSQLAGAEVTVLAEPSLEALTQALWQGCDLLFFAGHSSSRTQGALRLSAEQELTLEQLKYALRGAIANGLKLAIFNACDGLGLARSLADLSIPQVIVMREPVPDPVAHAGLNHFLAAFSQGQSLYRSVRTAREKLQGLEADYPCASWLPVIYQNPAEAPATWTQWQTAKQRQTTQRTAQRSNSVFERLRLVALASLLSTALVTGIRHLGWLQSWELQTFDQLMRLRPEEGPDPRLLIVSITEDDFQLPEQAQRRGSLSDPALEQLLQKLEPLEPRAIGLDIYRDFSVEPDQSSLADQLRQQENIYAICKVSDLTIHHPGIAPPPEFPPERQGFSDVIKDPDDVLRRHLIAMNPPPTSPCTTPYALSTQLALHYLDSKGVAIDYTPEGALKVGDVLFDRLPPNGGGYQTVDTWGYQILLNYRATRSPLDIAPTITLAEILNDPIQAAQFKDRIVLIGVTASSAGDFLMTPAGQSNYRLPGVVAQAHMTSQILSAVEDGRPLLTVWPRPAALFWIWAWAMVGESLVGWMRSRLPLLLAIGLALCSLSLSCLWLLIQGTWAPLIPAALTLLLTGSIIALYQSFLKNTPRSKE